MPRIGLLGGEATGKSSLARALASCLPACVVEEELRSFVRRHGRAPEQSEQSALMARQVAAEDAVARSCGVGTVVADPAALMTAVYSLLYFDDDTLLAAGVEQARGYRLMVWCATDLPWTADDAQRDGPRYRDEADRIIRRVVDERLRPNGIEVVRVDGDLSERVAEVTRAWQPRRPDRPT